MSSVLFLVGIVISDTSAVTSLLQTAHSTVLPIDELRIKFAYLMRNPKLIDQGYIGTGQWRRVNQRINGYSDPCDNGDVRAMVEELTVQGLRPVVEILAIYESPVSRNNLHDSNVERYFKDQMLKKGIILLNRNDIREPSGKFILKKFPGNT